MKTFRTFLAELTDRPYEYLWANKETTQWKAWFKTEPIGLNDNKPVEFFIKLIGEEVTPRDVQQGQGIVPPEILNAELIWNLSFQISVLGRPHIDDPWGVVPSGGQQIRILSTVVNALQEFAREAKPEVIGFTAKEPSRIKLYQRFVQQAARYLPEYEGSGPYPRDTWNRWMSNYVGTSPFFLLVRKETDEQITPVTSELHD